MPLLGGAVTIHERTSPLSSSPACEARQAQLLLCPANCGCKNSLPRLAQKSRVVKDYGLRSGNAELIWNTYIAEGEIVAVFGETATIWSQDDVCEFERVAVKQNDTESDVPKFEFITVQAMQEHEDGNVLTTVKSDVTAVLRAKREIQPGEFLRYQYTDQSVHLKKIFECQCCFHVGLCQPHGRKSMLERLAAAPKQSFPEMRTLKVGALAIVKTGGVAQQWRVSNIKIATGTLVTIKFENSEMTVDESWFVFDANSDYWFLQRLGFFGDMALKRTTNSFQVWRDILNPGKMMNGEAPMVLLEWTIYGFSGENKQGLPASQSNFGRGWLTGLCGSLGLRKTNPIKDC